MLTAWAAVTLTFFALRLASGDPVASILSQGLASPTQAEALRHRLGLDLPLLVQYLRYLMGFLRGDLGYSLYTGRPVLRTIGEQFPATATLALSGLAVAGILGLLLGVSSVWWGQRSWIGRSADNVSGLATSFPVSFAGILAILLLTLVFRQDQGTAAQMGFQVVAPALVLGFAPAGAIARVVQVGLYDSLRAPFVLAARARGIGHGLRLLWHSLRPALPPVVSLSALEAAFLFSGTVVTETVFSRPGLGRLLVTSILQGDLPVAQGLVALAGLLYTASHVLADLMSIYLDPRIRRSP